MRDPVARFWAVEHIGTMLLAVVLAHLAAASHRTSVSQTGLAADNAPMPAEPEVGIPLTLAIERAHSIERLRYDLAFDIPSSPTEPIHGRVSIHLTLADRSRPLVIDFNARPDCITSVSAAGRRLRYRAANGHIVIHEDELASGENVIEIGFRAGDAALSRAAQFLYTLFVPARAHLAFPCFDQPDLKATFGLELTMPVAWQSVANGPESSRETVGRRVWVRFADTRPIPTYLFAFAAGEFQVETAVRGLRTFRMFHRETDALKVTRNRDVLFDLHASALAWLEEYTAIPYQFGKFDFVLVPSFQFSGMEHPGAVFYNAEALLLDGIRNRGPGARPRAFGRARERAHVVWESRDDEVVR